MSGAISNPEIIAALSALRGEDGRILPEHVVEAAQKKDSPLHNQFEWNNNEAAHRYRIEQAKNLLRVCVTVLPGSTAPVRAFVSLSNETGYRSTGQVMINAVHRSQLLEDAKRDMESFQTKYKHLSEVSDVIAAMKRTQQQKLAR